MPLVLERLPSFNCYCKHIFSICKLQVPLTCIIISNLFPGLAKEALQMSPSTTQIEVSWELSSSLCSPDYYIIRYSFYQKLACQSPESTPSEFEVNTNVTQYNKLVGLEPYSRYKISVTAVNGAGQSEPTIGYSDTSQGRE